MFVLELSVFLMQCFSSFVLHSLFSVTPLLWDVEALAARRGAGEVLAPPTVCVCQPHREKRRTSDASLRHILSKAAPRSLQTASQLLWCLLAPSNTPPLLPSSSSFSSAASQSSCWGTGKAFSWIDCHRLVTFSPVHAGIGVIFPSFANFFSTYTNSTSLILFLFISEIKEYPKHKYWLIPVVF